MRFNLWLVYRSILWKTKTKQKPTKIIKKTVHNLVKNQIKVTLINFPHTKIELIHVKNETIQKTEIILWKKEKVISTKKVKNVKAIIRKIDEIKITGNLKAKRRKEKKIIIRVEINVREKKTTFINNKITSLIKQTLK